MQSKEKRLEKLDQSYREKVKRFLETNNSALADNVESTKHYMNIYIDEDKLFMDKAIKSLDLDKNLG
jgi:mRNA-degrading endonuclease RelE of RelBE toxin-antitoxin system